MFTNLFIDLKLANLKLRLEFGLFSENKQVFSWTELFSPTKKQHRPTKNRTHIVQENRKTCIQILIKKMFLTCSVMYLDEMGAKLLSKSADFEVGGVGVRECGINELSFVGLGKNGTHRSSGYRRWALWLWFWCALWHWCQMGLWHWAFNRFWICCHGFPLILNSHSANCDGS